MNTSVQKKIREYRADFHLTPTHLAIELQNPTQDFTLKGTIPKDHLPTSCNNIFDTIDEVYQFIRVATPFNIDLNGEALLLRVQCIKMREVVIELNKELLSKEDVLDRKINTIQKRTQYLQNYINNEIQRHIAQAIEDKSKKIMKAFNQQVKKMHQKINYITANTVQQIEATHKGKLEENLQKQITKSTQSIMPEQKDSHNKEVLCLDQPQKRIKLIEFFFDIDPINRFLENFCITNNTISKVKKNTEIVMVYASNPIPQTNRHSVRFRINRITEGFIWVGLMTAQNKGEMYIGKEPNTVHYCLNGKQVVLHTKEFPITSGQAKSGDVISMEVQVTARKLRWFCNGRDRALLKVALPESMSNTQLFPFVQMISIGDSVTFL